jgi:hypothetical protein
MEVILKSLPKDATKFLMILFLLGMLPRTYPHRKIPHLKIGRMVTTNDFFHEREHEVVVVSYYLRKLTASVHVKHYTSVI